MLGPERSIGFPKKNTTPFFGCPLISYPRLAAYSEKCVNGIYVPTDSKEIKRIALDHKVKTIDLSPELVINEA